jgi:hypothetical protein
LARRRRVRGRGLRRRLFKVPWVTSLPRASLAAMTTRKGKRNSIPARRLKETTCHPEARTRP